MTATLPNCLTTSDSFFEPLMEYVLSATGLRYYCERPREFATHVGSRLDALKLEGCLSYLRLLQGGSDGRAELDRLIPLLTIGETHFFRHRELFQALETSVFPHIIEKNRRQRRLRIWSAGCSIGAEPYSISMLLRRRFAASIQNWDIRIVGTDINRDFLARASAGQFEDWALRAVSPEERDACFLPEGKRWTVKAHFQHGVSFEYHNLASPGFAPPLKDVSGFDLILCRNVMIYFANSIVRQAINNLHDCLAPNGWLAVGHAEHNVDWFRSFRTETVSGAILYQKETAANVNAGATPESSPLLPGIPAAVEHCRSLAGSESAAVASPHPVQSSPRSARGGENTAANKTKQDLQEIRVLADRGDLQEALLRCQACQRRDDLNPAPHLFQALILQQIDEPAGAEQSLRRAIYLDRKCVLAHYYLGLLLQKREDPTRASRSFRNVLKLLAEKPTHELIDSADELTVADLLSLATSHLRMVEQ